MNIQTTQSEIIKAVQSIHNEQDLNDLKNHVHKIANGKNYSVEERALIEKIQEGLPEDKWERFLELENKQRQETITKTEMEELLQLSDLLETKDAERIGSMMELARMWNMSLEKVKTKFRIQTLEPYVW